jgi:hypothetical protein
LDAGGGSGGSGGSSGTSDRRCANVTGVAKVAKVKRHVLAMRKACDTVTRLVKHVRIYNVVSVAFLWDAHDAPFFHPAEAYHSSSRL